MTPDTNLLVRAVVMDDPIQTELATRELEQALFVVLTIPALCELCWVLRSQYGYSTPSISEAIEAVVSANNVRVDDGAVEVGLAMLARGGDFADGIIAYLGRRGGGREFVSFDRKAVAMIKSMGGEARLPGKTYQA